MSDGLFVSTYVIQKGGRREAVVCQKKKITREQLERYAEQLKDYLLKIDYSKYHSYDNSDDDRADCSESRWAGVKYAEINPLENSEHLLVQGDTVVGVVFVISPNSGRDYTRAFLFDGSVQEKISMGYSASHSSDWTYINEVHLVKRGEDGAQEEGSSLRFDQAEMYPSI